MGKKTSEKNPIQDMTTETRPEVMDTDQEFERIKNALELPESRRKVIEDFLSPDPGNLSMVLLLMTIHDDPQIKKAILSDVSDYLAALIKESSASSSRSESLKKKYAETYLVIRKTLAGLLWELGEIHDSIAILEDAADLSGNRPDIIESLSIYFLVLGDVGKAEAVLAKVPEADKSALLHFSTALAWFLKKQENGEAPAESVTDEPGKSVAAGARLNPSILPLLAKKTRPKMHPVDSLAHLDAVAEYYVSETWDTWHSCPGAVDFLKKIMPMTFSSPLFRSDAENKALDLFDEALDGYREDGNITKLRRYMRKVLELDPRNTDALVHLGHTYESAEKRHELYSRAAKSFTDVNGPKYFKENKGHFWGILETRPYMRAVHSLAQTEEELDYLESAADNYRHLLDICPNDNMGVRHLLLPLLVFLEEYDEARGLLKKYKPDHDAQLLFSQLLLQLDEKKGIIKAARETYKKAVTANKYIVPMLLGDIPRLEETPPYFSPGSVEEADLYLDTADYIWESCEDAMDKLRVLAGE